MASRQPKNYSACEESEQANLISLEPVAQIVIDS